MHFSKVVNSLRVSGLDQKLSGSRNLIITSQVPWFKKSEIRIFSTKFQLNSFRIGKQTESKLTLDHYRRVRFSTFTCSQKGT